MFFAFSAIKYFPLAVCNASRNVAPFFALVLSAVCLSEPPTWKQTFILTLIVALSFGFILTGEAGENQVDLALESRGTRAFAYLCLCMQPLAIATGTALVRSLRKLDKNTISVC